MKKKRLDRYMMSKGQKVMIRTSCKRDEVLKICKTCVKKLYFGQKSRFEHGHLAQINWDNHVESILEIKILATTTFLQQLSPKEPIQ